MPCSTQNTSDNQTEGLYLLNEPEAKPHDRLGALTISQGDNLAFLERFESASFDLIYVDPPFNTGTTQRRTTLRTVADPDGDRTGFQGRRYRSEVQGQTTYSDRHDDYLAFLEPRLVEMQRLLSEAGALYLHLDSREVHYVKVLCDTIFGRDAFLNEIIWAYDYGGRSKTRWSPKHDNILWYSADPRSFTYRYEDIDRVPYMAPKLVGPEKAARGKTPTDTWWHTIVSPTARERTGYPTQKPLGILERIVRVHSNPGEEVLDFFAGSGSFGEAALKHSRGATLIDDNPEAIEVMRERLASFDPTVHVPPASRGIKG